jgi:hypothetical protein
MQPGKAIDLEASSSVILIANECMHNTAMRPLGISHQKKLPKFSPN